ncbi:hypothetical protein D3C81_1745280 [compost metagenome]
MPSSLKNNIPERFFRSALVGRLLILLVPFGKRSTLVITIFTVPSFSTMLIRSTSISLNFWFPDFLNAVNEMNVIPITVATAKILKNTNSLFIFFDFNCLMKQKYYGAVFYSITKQ